MHADIKSCSERVEPWPNGTALAWHTGGAGFESLGSNILCSPNPSEETINRGPNTSISTTHALITKELKDLGIPLKVAS